MKLTTKNKTYLIADTFDKQVKALDWYIENCEGLLAVDTETTSENPLIAQLMGISLCATEGESIYLAIRDYDKEKDEIFYTMSEEQLFQIRRRVIELFEKKNLKLIMHNSPYDVIVLRREIGADCLPCLYADTLLMKHTVDERKPHGLKPVAIKFFGEEAVEEQDALKENVIKNGGRWTKDTKEMYKADLEILGKYACADTDLTLKLFTPLREELFQQGLLDFYFKDEVHPLNEVTINMVERGVRVDVPYFEELNKNLINESVSLIDQAHEDLEKNHTKAYEAMEDDLLVKEYPLLKGGDLFRQMFVDSGLPFVYNKKTGRPTFSAKVIEDALKDNPDSKLLQWKLNKITDKQFEKAESALIRSARKKMFLEKSGTKFVVNLGSTQQLGALLFGHLGESPIKKTKEGGSSVDDEVLEQLAPDYRFVEVLSKYRKANKLRSTYVEAALSKNIEGIVHPNWLQFGTDSGRYSCKDPNYQNLPRDDDRIKKGILARDGYVFIGPDYSQLEPRTFAHCSNEPALIQAYINGEDLYGAAAVDIFKLNCTPNEVKTKYPDKRQTMKTLLLAITYGAKKWKVSKILGCSLQKAEKFIDNYFNTYQNLHAYVNRCHGRALTHERIETQAGRVRRLTGIKLLRKSRHREEKLRSGKLLNLSVNFTIQSLAASIVNRAMIAMNRKFKELGLDAHVLIQVHDEIVVEAREDQAEQVRDLMKDIMENNYKLSVPLLVEPRIGKRLSETK